MENPLFFDPSDHAVLQSDYFETMSAATRAGKAALQQLRAGRAA
jgi:hypothetical protein